MSASLRPSRAGRRRSPHRRLDLLRAAWAALGAAALIAPAGAQEIAPMPPIEHFLDQGRRAEIDELVKRAVKGLGTDSSVDRELAALELAELGAPAEVALLRELGASGSPVVRRAGLRALFRLGPAPASVELAWSWAENPTLHFDRRACALLELGGPFGLEPERAERAGRLGRIAAAKDALAECAAFALVRLRTRGAELGALRGILSGQASDKLKGALALYLARFDPESLPAIAALAQAGSSEWLRAAAWLALADAGRGALPEALRDAEKPGVVLSLCASLACVPRDAAGVDALAQRLDAEQRMAAFGGLVLALAASGLPRAEELLATRATDLAARARSPLLQAAVALRSGAVLAAVHRSAPLDARESAMDFAALVGMRCFGLAAGEALVARDPDLRTVGPVLESARRLLVERTAEGSAEAALALLLHGRPLPEGTDLLARDSRDLALVLRLGGLLASGDVDERTVRRVGVALGLRRGVDPRAWRDHALHLLATSALGHESVPFDSLRTRDVKDPRDPGPNDLFLPSAEPVPPIAKDSDYYEDLSSWLDAKPFRTRVDQVLGR